MRATPLLLFVSCLVFVAVKVSLFCLFMLEHVDVFPPDVLNVPSVSVSPSGEIMENSSVTLTCSNDATQSRINTTWYKNKETQLTTAGTGRVKTHLRHQTTSSPSVTSVLSTAETIPVWLRTAEDVMHSQ
uniref:Ig-like domain-containing protein n=1 Tax=Salarias fasciatus TaxID=181472 RepID=A0A672G466_SALFA